MTAEQLEDLQRMVALRMSLPDHALGWSFKEQSTRISRRVATVQMWTADETRPTFTSALLLAADAMVLLAMVDKAEQDDWSTGDEAA
jgi:hypothetical protein